MRHIPNPIIVVLAAISLFAVTLTGLALVTVNVILSVLVWLFLVSKLAAIAIWGRLKPWLI